MKDGPIPILLDILSWSEFAKGESALALEMSARRKLGALGPSGDSGGITRIIEQRANIFEQ